jgi:hypothetical protein
MTTDINKVSSQGVRDYPIDKKKQSQNEDLGDVYEQFSTKEAPHFDTNKEVVSNPAAKTKKKRRIANKNHSMDFVADPFDLPGKDFIHHQYNTDLREMTAEARINFVEEENAKILNKVNSLSEALQAVVGKMKQKQESKPPQIFMRNNQEFDGEDEFHHFLTFLVTYYIFRNADKHRIDIQKDEAVPARSYLKSATPHPFLQHPGNREHRSQYQGKRDGVIEA